MTVEPGGKLVIPVGLDRGVRLARQATSRRTRAGFRGQQTRTEYKITLAVSNKKRRPIDVVLLDRVPRPMDPRIRIMDVQLTPATAVYDAQSDSGEVRFELRAPAGGRSVAELSYAVEIPTDLGVLVGGPE